MTKRDLDQINKLDLTVVMQNGGLGDHIACLPAIRALHKQPNTRKIVHGVQHYFIGLFKHFMENYKLPSKPITTLHPGRTYTFKGHTAILMEKPVNSLATSLVDFAFMCFLNRQPTTKDDRSYPKLSPIEATVRRIELPKRFFVLSTGFTSPARVWKAVYVNEVARYLKGRGITPVFLGSSTTQEGVAGNFDETIDYSIGLDLREQTSLVGAGTVIARSEGIAGVDNGLLHLAGCTDVPIVAGYTSVEPELRMPIRDNTPGKDVRVIRQPKSLACRYCQSRFPKVPNHDYKDCLFDDFACQEYMTGERFIAEIEEVLR